MHPPVSVAESMGPVETIAGMDQVCQRWGTCPTVPRFGPACRFSWVLSTVSALIVNKGCRRTVKL